MTQSRGPDLLAAVAAYKYPAVTYDFIQEQEHHFPTVRDLDEHFCSRLRTAQADAVKDALSGIVYWGHYRAGFRMRRVKRFRDEVTDDQLRAAIVLFPSLTGTGLIELKTLRLPQFSNMAFLTKLRTFLDPDRFCVLDSKIATLNPLANRLKRYPTSIPVTHANDAAYAWWVNACQSLASPLGLRPVDVERGLFHLLDTGRRAEAESLLSATP